MKKNRKLWVALLVILLCVLAIGTLVLMDRRATQSSVRWTTEEAEEAVRDSLQKLPLSVAKASCALMSQVQVQVQEVTYGHEKDIRLHCTYETRDVLSAYSAQKQDIFTNVYAYYMECQQNGVTMSAAHIMVNKYQDVLHMVETAAPVTGEIDLVFYDTGKQGAVLWLDDQTVDTLLGGLLSVRRDIDQTQTLTWEGEEVSIRNNNSLRRGIADCLGLTNYTSEKPDASTPILRAWNSFTKDFYHNFIEENRWIYLAKGLGTTLAITGLALLLGVVVGFVSAMIRTTHDKQGNLRILNRLVTWYVSIIRGTPVMIQLMIIYFVLLLPIGIEKFQAAVLCFGLNSGAYVSEIIRGGIMSVDAGQMEAGRSLGFSYVPTMVYIILPQAFKAVLPALCNEFIALLKETSVAFYIGVADLTQGGLKIRSITYSNFMPLIAIAVIYLVLVMILTKLVGLLEKKLRKSER